MFLHNRLCDCSGPYASMIMLRDGEKEESTMCFFYWSPGGGTMASETRAIYRRTRAVAKSVVQKH